MLGRADIWLPKLVEEGGSRERGETPFLKGAAPEEPSELAKYALITRITAAGQTRFLTELDDALIDRMLDTAVRLIEPLMLVIIAGIVVLVVISLLLPMMKMSGSV